MPQMTSDFPHIPIAAFEKVLENRGSRLWIQHVANAPKRSKYGTKNL
jgi:hypothetical protein